MRNLAMFFVGPKISFILFQTYNIYTLKAHNTLHIITTIVALYVHICIFTHVCSYLHIYPNHIHDWVAVVVVSWGGGCPYIDSSKIIVMSRTYDHTMITQLSYITTSLITGWTVFSEKYKARGPHV